MNRFFKVSEQILRVVCTDAESIKEPSMLIVPQPEYTGACLVGAVQEGDRITYQAGGQTLFTQLGFTMEPKEVYRYTFSGDMPKIVTRRTVDGERSFVENAGTVKVGDAAQASVTFAIEETEAIYGLGQHENGVYNYRNTTEYLYHNNMKIPMPVYLSSKNYAVLFDCTSMLVYEEKDNRITMTLDAVEQIDFYIIAGNSFDELVAGIRRLTGDAPMLPEWAFGYIQSRERYKTQEEILANARRFQEEEIPLGCIVLDWLSWEDGKWGNMIFDKKRFPDAKAMVEELHRMGAAFMISVWPNRKEGCENHTEFLKAGKLLCNNSTYDAFDEEARDIYWKQCERELFPAGIDAWWCDSSEPFTPDWNGEVKRPDAERYQMAKDSTNQYLDARTSNVYPVVHAQGIYEHQRAADSSKRVTNLTRAGYPGIQKYGTILWSGDIAATWDVFRNQVAEGLSISMCGIPYWTLDVGGFFAGSTESWKRWANVSEGRAPWFWHGLFEEGVRDKGYCELYTRWLQLGAFLPVMRSHGTDTPREPWQFGEKGTLYYDTIVKYIKLRYALMPYHYSIAAKTALDGGTMMRSLMFDFAADAKVKEIADEYMYGPAFLVCPVLEPMEYGPDSTPLNNPAVRDVYLPAGTDWYDYETKNRLPGGRRIQADAPVEKMPLFVRSGALIPKSAAGVQTPDTLEIYGGSDGAFALTIDNGVDYAYEQGQYAKIHVIWNDAQRTLVLEQAEGEYPLPEMELQVMLYGGEGGPVEAGVRYSGARSEIRLP